jgi:MoaA/NifB/PqqE/SkfB family radical SAM enzyme
MTLQEARDLYFYKDRKKENLEFTKERTITRRGVLWLGQTCNLDCYFCYFRDKIDNKEHPEHPFMSLEKAKEICHTLRYTYANRAVDIQGGEPTIYPHIFELISYCKEIGLEPTLITNAIVLADFEMAKKFKDAGVKDFLVSIHAIGETYDRIVGLKNGSVKQMKALYNLQKLEIPFRLNCTMTKEAGNQLEDIATLAIETGARVVNFIAFNPFADQQGKRNLIDVPKYSDLKENLQKAIDLLEKNSIEVNVRYFPICMLDEPYRKNIYNFQQLSYDNHEWDFNSWTWTTRFNQKSNSPELDRPIPILLYNLNEYNGIDFSQWSKHGTKKHYYKDVSDYEIFELMLQLFSADVEKELLYKNNAKLRAEKHTNYRKCETCENCNIKDICDGFHGDYAEVFGMDEAKAIKTEKEITDCKFYIKEQLKVID